MNRLKTCPFCGGLATYHRAEIKIKGKTTDTITIKCSVCNARTKRHLFDSGSLRSQNDAYMNVLNAWNRRV